MKSDFYCSALLNMVLCSDIATNNHSSPIGLNIILRNKNETQVLCEVHIDSPLTLPLNGCREIIFWGFFVNENREKDVTLNL